MESHIYQLLGARFCHDMASPINGLGLILEMLQENPAAPSEDLLLAKEAQTRLTRLLQFYRLFFSYRSGQDLFHKALKMVEEWCQQGGIEATFDISEENILNADGFGKEVACLFYSLSGSLKQGDRLILTCPEDKTAIKLHEDLLNKINTLQIYYAPIELTKKEIFSYQICGILSVETDAALPIIQQAAPKSDSSENAFSLFLTSLLKEENMILMTIPDGLSSLGVQCTEYLFLKKVDE